MIVLRDLNVRRGRRLVVRDVTLTIERGRWTTLIGPNGAGKTTVLRAVAGLVPYSGSVIVDRLDPSRAGNRQRARAIALVAQEPLLPDDMTVTEYVLLGRTPHLGYLGRSGSRDRDIIAETLTRLDLADLQARRLATLSGGERRRAVLARALAQDAPILLLDEPTTALDVGRQQEVLELVALLRRERGLTVLSAMHDLTLAGHYADQLALIDGGELIAAGPPEKVLTEHLIARHYNAHVRVTNVAGTRTVVPAPPP